LVARSDGGYELRNSEPDLLAHFVYSTVWKFAVSQHGRDNGLRLGPYEIMLRDRIFGTAPTDLPFLVGRHQFKLNKADVAIGIPPHRQKLKDWRTWLFVIGGLQFHLKLDQRPFPAEWSPFLANGNDPLLLTPGTGMDIREVPILKPIFQRMVARRKP
jgi:hypothetical protein